MSSTSLLKTSAKAGSRSLWMRSPSGLHTITPYLVVESVSTLIQFLQQVFDAESRGDPQYREDGSVKHAEVRIGDSVVMMGEPMDEIGPMPATMYLYVNDCDATYEKALAAGATSVLKPDNYPHGDRYVNRPGFSGELVT